MFDKDELNVLCAALEDYKQSYSSGIQELISSQPAAGEGIKAAAENSIKNMDSLLIKLRKLQMKAHGL